MSDLWGIGSYDDGNGRVAWPISNTEMHRDMGAAGKTLARLGLGGGERVLFCSMLSEAGQFWPLIVGALLGGAQLSCADANAGDAMRVAMFTRLMAYRAVLGVTSAILDGLDELERDYNAVFGDVPIVGARPGAHGRLRAAGLRPCHAVLCGPVLAVADEPDAPALVDGDEWELIADGDRVVVSNKRERATTFDRAPTAVRGRVVDGGVIPEE